MLRDGPTTGISNSASSVTRTPFQYPGGRSSSQIMHPGLTNLILAHLSEVNNHPEVAKETMLRYLQTINAPTRLIVADQYLHAPLIDV